MSSFFDLRDILDVLKLFALVFDYECCLLAFDGLDVGELLQLNFEVINRHLQLFVETRHRDEFAGLIQLLLCRLQVFSE